MFLDFLLAQHSITELQYNHVLATLDTEFEGNITKALLSVGISEDAVTQAKAAFYKVPYQKINPPTVTPDVLKYIEEEAARHYKFVPIAFADDVLSVGVTEPENIEAMNALQFISAKIELPFKIFVISYSDFIATLENYKVVSQEVDKAVNQLNEELEIANKEVDSGKKSTMSLEKKDENKLIEDAPIIKIVAVIINHAVEGNASDIHIEHTGQNVKVRYRVDGILHTTLVLPINTFDGVTARFKILA